MIPTLHPATVGAELPLPEFVTLAAKYGFEGVDFSIIEIARLATQHGFPAVAAIFEKHVVLPAAFMLPVDWCGAEESFQAGLAQLPALAKLAQDLSCTRCITPVLPVDATRPAAEYAATSIPRLTQVARVLANEGVRLGLEFVGTTHFRTDEKNIWFYDIAGALRVVDEIQNADELENVGLLVDSFHWFTSGGRAMDLASIPIEQIVHVHINDAPDVSAEEQIDSKRLLPGASGVIDLTAFLQTLSAIGYDGPVAAKTFNEELRAVSADEAARLASQAVNGVFTTAGIEPVRLV